MSVDSQELVGFFCKHLVALCVTYRHKGDEAISSSRFVACSGTLFRWKGSLFFLTAGHVLRALGELRASENVIIENAVLADTFGLKRVSDKPIPFALKVAPLFYIDEETPGLDFGLIPVGRHHENLLLKNGILPLEECYWKDQETTSFDRYFLLGIPEEFSSERVSPSGEVSVAPALIVVERIELNKTKHERIVGRVKDNIQLDSLRGMSGGVLIGFNIEKSRYWILGVQSSWDKNSRTIYAWGIPTLISLLEKAEAA